MDYAVITPVRDEADSLPRTARSIIDQTRRPSEWIIVDDGSTDGTRDLAASYADAHAWIRLLDRPRSTGRARGASVVAAFHAGYAALRDAAEVVVKLDGDLYLPPHYFAWILATFEREPRAGIVGGVILEHDGTVWRPAGFNPRHVRGAFKAYRRECLSDIGGLQPAMGWDGIDEYGARARGWGVHVLTELVALHYRRRGGRQNWWRARLEEGRACHFMGYRPDFMLLRMPYRAALDWPPVLGAVGVAAGYMQSHATRAPTSGDAEARRALREEQREAVRALVGRRRRRRPEGLPGGGPAFWTDERDRRP